MIKKTLNKLLKNKRYFNFIKAILNKRGIATNHNNQHAKAYTEIKNKKDIRVIYDLSSES